MNLDLNSMSHLRHEAMARARTLKADSAHRPVFRSARSIILTALKDRWMNG